jgi:hypothetical protein
MVYRTAKRSRFALILGGRVDVASCPKTSDVSGAVLGGPSVQAWGWWSSLASLGRNTLDFLVSTVSSPFCGSGSGVLAAPAGPFLYPTPSF